MKQVCPDGRLIKDFCSTVVTATHFRQSQKSINFYTIMITQNLKFVNTFFKSKAKKTTIGKDHKKAFVFPDFYVCFFLPDISFFLKMINNSAKKQPARYPQRSIHTSRTEDPRALKSCKVSSVNAKNSPIIAI